MSTLPPITAGSDAAPQTPPAAATSASAAVPPWRLFYWSVRREIWENRAFYLAPLAIAGLVLLGFVLGFSRMGRHWQSGTDFDAARKAAEVAIPYAFAAMAVLLTSILVGVFYCLGALYNERRDRGILFWKSLPVSDLITVLAKASVPLAVLPAIAFVTILALQLIMLALNIGGFLATGQSLTILSANLPLPQMTLVLAYGLVTLALWLAPIYGWLLLVSAWARRTPFLWALLPPLGLCLVEKIAFDTSHFWSLLGYRLTGGIDAAFNNEAPTSSAFDQTAQLDPAKFLATPGLWAGLVFFAACLAAAVWLRRRREPI